MVRKVVDHILFNDEVDMLLARMKILWPVVDEFRVYESTYTFTGKPKPLYCHQNAYRFTEFRFKLWVTDIQPDKNPWVNEARARNSMEQVPGALNILSDVDEIPSRATIQLVNTIQDDLFPILNLQDFYYYDTLTKWMEPCKCSIFFLNARKIQKLRENRDRHRTIYGGWHFSYFGGMEQIKRKLQSFSHQEIKSTDDELMKALNFGSDFIKSGKRGQLVRLKENNDLPEYVRQALQIPLLPMLREQ